MTSSSSSSINSSSSSSSSSSSRKSVSIDEGNTNLRASNHLYLQYLKANCQMIATKLFNALCIRHERRRFLVDVKDYEWRQVVSTLDISLVDYSNIDNSNNNSSSRSSNSSSSSNSASGGSNNNISSSNGSSDFDIDNFDANIEDNMIESSLLIKNNKLKAILIFIPQVLPFNRRVDIFHSHLQADKNQFYRSVGKKTTIWGLMGVLYGRFIWIFWAFCYTILDLNASSFLSSSSSSLLSSS